MSWYRQRVERDLSRWQTAGWVNEEGATAIRAELASRRPAFGAAPILAILGAVLFGFAAMSFVAANWDAMPKLARLLLLLGTLWACYAGAAYLFAQQLNAFAHAALLGGIAVFGASIMLIAQMYHIEGNAADAMLTWSLGAFLAALLARSNPALAATFVLATAWTCWERSLGDAAHWSFLVLWAAMAAAAAWMRWRPGLHLAALSLAVWLVPLGYFVLGGHAHWVVAVIGAGVALAAALGAHQIDRRIAASQPIFAYAVAIAFAALFIMQFIDDTDLFRPHAARPIGRLLWLAVLTLGLLLAAMLWAITTDNRGALWLAYTAFAAEIFALYVRTLGTLLNTSLFFLIAALIVSGLAWAAYRIHQRQAAPTRAAA